MPKRLSWKNDVCMLCGACVAVCPVDRALVLHTTFLEIDHEKCIRCGTCVRTCPVGALALTESP